MASGLKTKGLPFELILWVGLSSNQTHLIGRLCIHLAPLTSLSLYVGSSSTTTTHPTGQAQKWFWSSSQGSRKHFWSEKLSQSSVKAHSTREAVSSSSSQAGEDAQCVELQKMHCWWPENSRADSSWSHLKKKKVLCEAEWHHQSANSL